jgi:hypothetical protein
MASLTPQQLAQMFAGNGPMAMPSYTMDDIYGGILPSMGGGNPALNAINAATPTAPMAPASWMAYEGGVPVASSVGGAAMPPVPRARPANAPTRLDMAAINAPMAAAQPVTRVSGQMQPESSGGLLDLLLGKSKNGMPGLLGLLGGPQQGGLLQMLLSGARKPAAAAPGVQRPMTSAQRYAAANSGPGSVAAMELLHSGASRNPQSGGPASGGEYASGGR